MRFVRRYSYVSINPCILIFLIPLWSRFPDLIVMLVFTFFNIYYIYDFRCTEVALPLAEPRKTPSPYMGLLHLSLTLQPKTQEEKEQVGDALSLLPSHQLSVNGMSIAVTWEICKY